MFLQELRKSVKPLIWVVAAGFVISLFFMYTRMSSREGEKPLVKVNGGDISYLDFTQAYRDAYDRYVESTGERISPEIENYLKTQVLSQLVSNELLHQEAKRANIKVSDMEVNEQIEQIMRSFGSRENFMRYLGYRRINYSDFEENIDRQIAVSKLTRLVQNSVIVTEQEVKDYWVLENENLNLAYLFLDPEKYTPDIKVDSEEVKKYYEANKEEFEVPEKIRTQYILVAPDEFKDDVEITEEDLHGYYQKHLNEFQVEEERRASHILIGVPETSGEESQSAAREKMQQIQQELEEGADFAELAKKYSDDTVSAEQGGDLGFFTYDTMTPEFSKAVFSLQEIGDVSDIVESPYGLHVIKLTGINPTYEKPFEEVKDDIKKAILEESEEDLAREEIEQVKEKIGKGELSFEEYAKEHPHRVTTTSLFSRYEKVGDLSWNPGFNETAFSLEPGKTSSPLRLFEGWCIVTLREKKPAYIPDWDEAQNEAVEKLAREKAEKITAQRAQEIAKKAREESGDNLASFSEEWEYETLLSTTRDSWVEGIYDRDKDKFLEVAFSLPSGEISDPFTLSDGYYIINVLERNLPLEEFAQEKDEFRQQLLARKREEFLSSWFLKVREKAKIVDNTALFFTSSP